MGYNSLGLTLGDDPAAKVKLPTGISWSKQELHAKAIDLDPRIAAAWGGLADTLGRMEDVHPGKRVHLSGNSSWDRQQLLLEAIRLDGSIAHAYNSLGLTLGDDSVRKH